MKDPTIIQAKRYGVFSCGHKTSLIFAARLMAEEDISALVVLDDDGFLAGIISRMDLLKAHKTCEDWAIQPVERFMSQQVVTVNPKDRLSHVTNLLLDNQIHRVVAVQEINGKQRPVAVVSSADLIYHMTKDNL